MLRLGRTALWRKTKVCLVPIPVCSCVPPPGGLPGTAAAPHRGPAGTGEWPAHGRALLPAEGRLPAAGVHRLHGPPAPAGDAGVQGGRLEAQQHGQQVLLQWAERLRRQWAKSAPSCQPMLDLQPLCATANGERNTRGPETSSLLMTFKAETQMLRVGYRE